MKKIMLFACTFLVGILSISNLSAATFRDRYNGQQVRGQQVRDMNPNERYVRADRPLDKTHYEQGEIDPNCAYISGPCVCYCPVTRFKPQYYCTERCEKEPYTVTKKCYRCVPQHYCVQKCRYVPQYYTEQKCRYVTECYDQCETCYRDKKCKDWHCRYVPYTCYERRCMDAPAGDACPTCPTPVCPTCP